MKTTTCLPLLFLLYAISLFSQSNIQHSLSVNGTGAAADASAQLDVSATDKGMLVPRMTTAERSAIASPATGLLVFDTTTGSFWFYNGTVWVNLSTPKVLADADGDTKIQVEESPNENTIRFDIGGTERMILRTNPAGLPRLELVNLQFNTFVGQYAGSLNTTGYDNTAVGLSALSNNTTGYYNTATGVSALSLNETGFNNTATGRGALNFNNTGFGNTANGFSALSHNTSGYFNTATGSGALAANTTGINNTANGVNALAANTTGLENTASGTFALTTNTIGYSNTANGVRALFLNTDGFENTANGHHALYSNTTGFKNTANGESALYSNTSGSSNTANGYEALYANTIGFHNAGIGRRALYNNTSGMENTAIGSQALYANTTGNSNTATGYDALTFNTTGSENASFGFRTLYANTTGNFNTAIGIRAYFTSTGLNNTTCLGYFTGGISNVSNRIEIGNTSVSWIGGQVGWSTYSDARIKTQVQENVPGLAFITKLRPVTYHLDIHQQNEMCFSRKDGQGKKEEGDWDSKYDIEQKQMTGFIAQEVEQAALSVGYDFSGVEKAADEVGVYSVRYSDFVVPLVKAVQEQQAIIENLQSQLSEMDELKNRLARLENALLGSAEMPVKAGEED